MRVQALEQLRVRKRTGRDDAFVLALATTAFAEYSLRSGPHSLMLVQSGNVRTVIASRGRRDVGFASVEFGREGASLQAIAVVHDERGRGVGARLLDAAEELARARGARVLRLCTAEANVEALQLFLRAGFRIARRMPSYYARGQNACAMSKLLGESVQ